MRLIVNAEKISARMRWQSFCWTGPAVDVDDRWDVAALFDDGTAEIVRVGAIAGQSPEYSQRQEVAGERLHDAVRRAGKRMADVAAVLAYRSGHSFKEKENQGWVDYNDLVVYLFPMTSIRPVEAWSYIQNQRGLLLLESGWKKVSGIPEEIVLAAVVPTDWRAFTLLYIPDPFWRK